PGQVLALTVLSPLGRPVYAIAVVEQRGEVRVAAHVDAPPGAPVSAVGTALGNKLFAAEAAGPGPPWSADDVDDRSVDEHHDERGTRNAECGPAPPPPRAVRIAATGMA